MCVYLLCNEKVADSGGRVVHCTVEDVEGLSQGNSHPKSGILRLRLSKLFIVARATAIDHGEPGGGGS